MISRHQGVFEIPVDPGAILEFQPAEENYQGEENAAGQNNDVAEDDDGDAGVIAIEDDSDNEIEGQDQIVIDD